MVGLKKVPAHIAIIMDGNGRWAKRRVQPRIKGHQKGLSSIRNIIQASLDLGVKFLTLYAFSSENWKRSTPEVDFLMKACEAFVIEELPSMVENQIRLKHIGRKDELSLSLRNCIENAEKLTAGNEKLCIQMAFNYGSRREIFDAVKRIVSDVQTGKLLLEDLRQEVISDYLDTAGVPDPDLLIRTSGEMRISNFLLWQVCYSEFYVTKTFWPDFNKKELLRAIKDYQRRRRRFGGTDE
jgi:undecaprenyl diphosphate synthase